MKDPNPQSTNVFNINNIPKNHNRNETSIPIFFSTNNIILEVGKI